LRILIVHNRYQFRGGEDQVFELERDLLAANGHQVETHLFDNDAIRSFWSKIKTGFSYLYSLRSRDIIRRKVLEFRPDVMHVHNLFPVATPSILYEATRLGVPVVMTLHNFRLICPSATLLYRGKIYERSVNRIFPLDAIRKKLYRDSVVETAGTVLMTGVHKLLNSWNRNVSVYIALTDFARKKFIHSSLNPSPDQIVVKPNFVYDPGYNQIPKDRFFLFVGRLSVEKGISVFLEAASGLPQYRFKIMGDGPLRPVVERRVADAPNIEFLGFQPGDRIRKEMRQARALIFPSIWYEGFPMTILEAFSAGTPVISSKLGSMEEIISPDRNGLHFSPGDPADLVRKIRLLGEDDALSERLSRGARQTYENHYTPVINCGQLILIYSKAIQRQKVPS
jgi:glycosyltransferase involved in cell wall biosynthesis